MNAIVKATALGLAAITLATSALEAQFNYASFFQKRTGGYYLFYGETASQVVTRANTLGKSGFTITDFEVYRTASGAVRVDTVYDARKSASYIRFGMSLSTLISVFKTQAGKGMHLMDVEGYMDDKGNRVYAALWKPLNGSLFYVNQTQSQMIATWKTNSTKGWRIAVMEIYHDKNGTLRYHTVYHPATGGHALWVGLTAADMAKKHSLHASTKLYMTELEVYTDNNNVQRFCAVFRPGTPSAFYYGRTQSQHTALWKSLSGAGWRLTDHEPRFVGKQPSHFNYGTGTKGTYRIPALTLKSQAWTGQNNGIVMGNSSNSRTTAFLSLGVRSANIPFLGGRLLVIPIVTAPIPLGASGFTLNTFTPADPSLNGTRLYLQNGILDRRAPGGLAMSRGLAINFGHRR